MFRREIMNMVTDFKAYVNSYDFKAYVDSYENTNTSTQLNAQSEDQEINNLTKQGYDGCTQHSYNMWDSSQGQNIRDNLCHGHCQSPSRHSTRLEM